MTEQEVESSTQRISWLPIIAAIVALIGIGDSIYLTVNHFASAPVPCSLISGCETVLTSRYAEVAPGIPLALVGAVAYFVAFSLSILAAFGNRTMWTLFGIQTALMTAVTLWLLYLQAFVIKAFCQFCLISAATTFTLVILFVMSKFGRRT